MLQQADSQAAKTSKRSNTVRISSSLAQGHKVGVSRDSVAVQFVAGRAAVARSNEGLIEITRQRDGRIFAVMTPEGRALLDWLRADRERDRERGAKPCVRVAQRQSSQHIDRRLGSVGRSSVAHVYA
jgi:hypothetical protein